MSISRVEGCRFLSIVETMPPLPTFFMLELLGNLEWFLAGLVFRFSERKWCFSNY